MSNSYEVSEQHKMALTTQQCLENARAQMLSGETMGIQVVKAVPSFVFAVATLIAAIITAWANVTKEPNDPLITLPNSLKIFGGVLFLAAMVVPLWAQVLLLRAVRHTEEARCILEKLDHPNKSLVVKPAPDFFSQPTGLMAQWLLALFASTALLSLYMWTGASRYGGLSGPFFKTPYIIIGILLFAISFLCQRVWFRRGLARYQKKLGLIIIDFHWVGHFEIYWRYLKELIKIMVSLRRSNVSKKINIWQHPIIWLKHTWPPAEKRKYVGHKIIWWRNPWKRTYYRTREIPAQETSVFWMTCIVCFAIAFPYLFKPLNVKCQLPELRIHLKHSDAPQTEAFLHATRRSPPNAKYPIAIIFKSDVKSYPPIYVDNYGRHWTIDSEVKRGLKIAVLQKGKKNAWTAVPIPWKGTALDVEIVQ